MMSLDRHACVQIDWIPLVFCTYIFIHFKIASRVFSEESIASIRYMYATIHAGSNQPGTKYRQTGRLVEFEIIRHIGRVLCSSALNSMQLVRVFLLDPALLVSPKGVSG
jgi:hypothetical protein